MLLQIIYNYKKRTLYKRNDYVFSINRNYLTVFRRNLIKINEQIKLLKV